MFIFVPIYAVSVFNLIVQRLGYIDIGGSAGAFDPKILLLINPLSVTVIFRVILFVVPRLIIMPFNFNPSIGTATRRHSRTRQKSQ